MNPDVPADRDLHEQNIVSISAVVVLSPRRLLVPGAPLPCGRVDLHTESNHDDTPQITRNAAYVWSHEETLAEGAVSGRHWRGLRLLLVQVMAVNVSHHRTRYGR